MTGILKQEPTSNLNEFINYSADLDKLRNQDLRESIPELWQQLKNKVEYKATSLANFKSLFLLSK